MFDEATVKTKLETAKGMMQAILDDLNDMEPVISTPFGFCQVIKGVRVYVIKDDEGNWIPAPKIGVDPEPEEKPVEWPEAGLTCSDFTFAGTEVYAPYIRKHMKTSPDAKAGAVGLVAECKTYWSKRDTFYEPIKQFIAMWPQYFPKEAV